MLIGLLADTFFDLEEQSTKSGLLTYLHNDTLVQQIETLVG